MAEYKPRLQLNNIDLSAILADINNLPPAGTEDISEELNAQTTAVNTLLNMVNRKIVENNGAGKWVWKKAWKYTVNLTQTTTGANPTKFKVTGSGNNTDFTDVGFIVGLKFVSDLGHTLEFIDETHMRHTNVSGSEVSDYTFTWDAANATVQMPAQWNSQHTFTEQEALRTKEFLVSSGEFDYPDRTYGDDGYWYAQYYEFYDRPDNIRQYIDIFGAIGSMSEGVSGIDYGKVTLSSSSSSITVSHTLGVSPSTVVLIPYGSFTGTSTSTPILMVTSKNTIYGSNIKTLAMAGYNTTFYTLSGYSTSTRFSGTTTNITLNTPSSSSYPKGTYYWFAIV